MWIFARDIYVILSSWTVFWNVIVNHEEGKIGETYIKNRNLKGYASVRPCGSSVDTEHWFKQVKCW